MGVARGWTIRLYYLWLDHEIETRVWERGCCDSVGLHLCFHLVEGEWRENEEEREGKVKKGGEINSCIMQS